LTRPLIGAIVVTQREVDDMEVHADKHHTVVKANQLIESRGKMSLNEQRILHMCLSNMDARTSDNPRSFTIALTDFKKAYGADMNIKRLKVAVDDLMSKQLILRKDIEINGKIYGRHKINWVGMASYSDGEIIVNFTPEIMPFLEELKASFTAYQLGSICDMSSAYGVRFYELLVQYKKIGERSFTIQEIRDIFMLEDKYKDIKDLKKRVIDKAVQQINEHSNMTVSHEYRKRGRRVVGVDFKFKIKVVSLEEAKPKKQIDKSVATTVAMLIQEVRMSFTNSVYINDVRVASTSDKGIATMQDGSKINLHHAVRDGAKVERK